MLLQDKDRIFRNLYGFHDWKLAGARLAAEHNISVAGFDPNTPIPSKQDGGK